MDFHNGSFESKRLRASTGLATSIDETATNNETFGEIKVNLSAEKLIAIDFALTADVDKCIQDPEFLEKVIEEYVSDLDRDEIRANLQVVQAIKGEPELG